MPKTLIYCTNGFPGDIYSEKTFVESELQAMRRAFDRIILLPCDRTPRVMGYDKSLPDGVLADWSLMDDRLTHSRLFKIFWTFHPFVLRSLLMMAGEARTPSQWVKGLFQAINTVTIGRVVRKVIRRYGLTPADTVFYCLWFHNSAAAMARIAAKEGWHMATRAHTSDIYDEQMVFRSRRVRDRLLSAVDRVFTISARGRDYLASRFPRHAAKFTHVALGSTRIFSPDSGNRKTGSRRDTTVFMTVARVVPVKRHTLIMDMLAEVARRNPSRSIVWHVIGDGECMADLRDRAARTDVPNFSVCFEGMLGNREIQQRYATDPPDWFVMMSYTEGVPVSMGEAMSYGVPVISTDVGSVAELADSGCALLLPRDIEAAEAAASIQPVIFDTGRQAQMSRAACARWQTRFDSAELSQRVSAFLDSLVS
ncbi:MAG: glycosyltransferase [Muribaculaceae bacterium]|nr:glycosyltransferase [Muribaculaceae bacterium]